MFRRLTIFISILLICQLSSAQTSPPRKSVSLDSGSEWKRTEEWGVFSVYYGSATFEYDEDYWKKDFDYSISINITSKNGPSTVEFPFGKLTMHEAGTEAYLYFSTIDEKQQQKYRSYTRSYAKEKGAENVVSILEHIFPTCNPEDPGGYLEIHAEVYVKNSDFSVRMNHFNIHKKNQTTQVPMPPPSR